MKLSLPNLKTKSGKHKLALYVAVGAAVLGKVFPDVDIASIIRWLISVSVNMQEHSVPISDIVSNGGLAAVLVYLSNFISDKPNWTDEEEPSPEETEE